jgi:uncharacterized membrane protein HdeD (DUF308 family)
MTDPRNNPAGSPGQDSGTSQPTPSGQQHARHGLFRRGTSDRSSSSKDTSGGTGSTATATRQETSTGAAVPQQAGQAPPERRDYRGEDYGRDRYGEDDRAAGMPGGTLLAKAAGMSWGLLLLGALGLIAVGIMLVAWPHVTLFVVSILIGAALVVTGIAKLWEGFTARDRAGGSRAGYVVIGLLAILAGMYCLRHHALSVFLIAFVAGVYFVAHGIADLGASFSTDLPGRGLRALLGVFSIGAGLVLVIWPGLSLTLLTLIAGAWLLFYGCVLAALALGVRKQHKEMTKRDKDRDTRTSMAQPRTA